MITISADWSVPTEPKVPIGPKVRVSKGTHKRFCVRVTLTFNGNYKPDSLDILILTKMLQINACSPRKEHYRKSLHSYYTHTFLKNANFQTLVWAFFLNYIDSEVTVMLKTRTKYILIFEASVFHTVWIYCLPALICIYSSCFVSAAPGSPAMQKEVLLSGLEREIICVSLKRDPKNGFGK